MIIHRRHNNEDTVGAERTRFIDLVWLVDEILAQRGQGGGVARRRQIFRLPLERRRVGQDRQTCCAAGLVGFRKSGRIEIGADQSFRRTCLLDLGNKRVTAGCDLFLDRAQKSARRRGGLCGPLKLRKRARFLRRGDLLALIGRNLFQNVGHGCALSAALDMATSRSRRACASPPSIALPASTKPVLEILRPAGDDQCCRRVQRRDVAQRTVLSLEHAEQ